jgi:hypothetical protein
VRNIPYLKRYEMKAISSKLPLYNPRDLPGRTVTQEHDGFWAFTCPGIKKVIYMK